MRFEQVEDGFGNVIMSEEEALRELIHAFSEAMLKKLLKKLKEGYSGWDNPEAVTVPHIRKMIRKNIVSNDPIDTANFAAFWWNQTNGKTLKPND